MELLVGPDGTVRCVYGEEIELAGLGAVEICRASHVEPDADGRWWADLSLVSGPVLGPFAQRSQALQAEAQWLSEHWPEQGQAA